MKQVSQIFYLPSLPLKKCLFVTVFFYFVTASASVTLNAAAVRVYGYAGKSKPPTAEKGHDENIAVAGSSQRQDVTVTGTVVDANGMPLPSANVIEKGTTNGTLTDFDGNYSITVSNDSATLVISYLGFLTKEIAIDGRDSIDVTLKQDAAALDEVVVVGYGTQKKKDLTGAVTSIDMSDNLKAQPNISVAQTLQGSVAGLNVGQTDQAGQEPDLSIRGRTSLSGAQNPLIVLDQVIFRGNLIDINPNDIKSIDILKDNSAAAVYGSQAANGVIIITTKNSGKVGKGPTINFSSKYSFQTPAKELKPGNGEYFVQKIYEHEWRESRTEASGYTERNPDWDVTPLFKTNEEKENYMAGVDTDWYGLLTNDNMFVNDQNLSISNRTDNSKYFISLGYTNQEGYMLNEGYERLNGRINIESDITDWLTVGIQSFASLSDYSGRSPSPSDRYIMPFESPYNEDGELNKLIENTFVNPLVAAQADNKDLRQSLFGNIFAEVDLPYIDGLKYRINASDTQITNRYYVFEPFTDNFQGSASKYASFQNNLAIDNRLTYEHTFNDVHEVNATLVYGIEKRKEDSFRGGSSIFVNDVLGYNALELGESEQQYATSGAWEENSLFTMLRVFYSFNDKYLFTGTFRRDGFSGFSARNKLGNFPSASVGWVASEESFFEPYKDVVNFLKLRVSYGSSGNRTVGRYQTLARAGGGYRYVDAYGNSVYTQDVGGLASPDLTWETTTGINVGLDFGLFDSRVSGSINYYNNNTRDLLYIVDLPKIGRFEEFPDNLGRLHNSGIELSLSSTNINTEDFTWTTDFSFSRNRDKLEKLLGLSNDNNGDGKEDDLISEGLFIGEPLSVVYDYEITGEKYQLDDELPPGYDYGTNVVVDQNNDGEINLESDRVILGYKDPSYRFSIGNNFRYKNLSLNVFINSIQGGKDYYYQENDLYELQYGDQYNQSYPLGYDDYWLPENPNAKYAKKSNGQPGGFRGDYYQQRSFIRLQDVSLNYQFGKNILDYLGFDNLNVFLSGKNLLTITDWEGWDPETGQGITRGGRPVLQSYTLGLNVQF